MRVNNFDLKWQFNATDLFQAQSSTTRQEIIGTRYVK